MSHTLSLFLTALVTLVTGALVLFTDPAVSSGIAQHELVSAGLTEDTPAVAGIRRAIARQQMQTVRDLAQAPATSDGILRMEKLAALWWIDRLSAIGHLMLIALARVTLALTIAPVLAGLALCLIIDAVTSRHLRDTAFETAGAGLQRLAMRATACLVFLTTLTFVCPIKGASTAALSGLFLTLLGFWFILKRFGTVVRL